MASRKELISKRRKELLEKGYPSGIVSKAMEWAVGTAQGMADYITKQTENDNPGGSLDSLANQFLPQYLNDAEKWIRSFGHEPKAK